MYATIHRYERVDTPTDELSRAGRHLARALGHLPGFISCALIDGGDGRVAAIGVFEDPAAARDAARLLAEWIADHLADRLPARSEVTTGEVIVQKGL